MPQGLTNSVLEQRRIGLIQTVLTLVDRVTLPRSLFHPDSRFFVQGVSCCRALLTSLARLLRLILLPFQLHEVDVVIAGSKALLQL